MASTLSKSQREWLEYAGQHLRIAPGPAGASSCSSLERRGLLRKDWLGNYDITQAGKQALAEMESLKPPKGVPLSVVK